MVITFFETNEIFLEIDCSIYSLQTKKHLDIKDFDSLLIKVFVCEKYELKYSPFTFYLKNNQGKLECNSELVKIYKLNNEEYYIKILPLIRDYSLLYFKDDLQIKNGTEIYYKSKRIDFEHFYAKNLEHFKKNNLDFFVLRNSFCSLFVVIQKDKIIFKEKINQYEIEENKLKTLTKLDDCLNHGIVKEYEINEEALNFKNSYSVYLNTNYVKNFVEDFKKEQKVFSNLVVPYFLQSGKAKNLNLCRLFLGENLKEKITIEKFSNYFGDFDFFEINQITDEITATLFYENTAKAFYFRVDRNQIIEIDCK